MLKKIAIAALISGQLASPAMAADLVDGRTESVRTGAFAGLRLRVSLDAEPQERVRGGLTFAPTRHDVATDGSARLRMGEGLEYGLSDRRAPELRFAGRPVRELAVGPNGRRQNISTIGWVAIGVVVVGVGAAAWFIDAMNDASD